MARADQAVGMVTLVMSPCSDGAGQGVAAGGMCGRSVLSRWCL
ncbi:hypothetical protein [Acetobacter musti]|nr:hypothetical protein [Acetobacter musti]